MRAWAKFPSAWLLPFRGEQEEEKKVIYPLAQVTWQGHRKTALAALLIGMGLAIRLNMLRREVELVPPTGFDRVAVTYDELEDIGRCARATVSKAVALLEALGAIKVHRVGRASTYQLIGLDKDGKWCQLPQSQLQGPGHPVHRLHPTSDRRSLNAVKVYLIMLALRSWKRNTTAISYDGITRYTCVRREDIPNALAMLTAWELIRVSDDLDDRREDGSRRYKVLGLGQVEARS